MSCTHPLQTRLLNQCILIALGIGLSAGRLSAAASQPARPNVIFVLSDDQRYATLGCTGNTFGQTPNLDQLAAEGTLFSQATVTSAICTPSRACYFLGQYERHHGINFNSGTAIAPAAWAQSYPVVLRAAGYFTGYVGKNHVPVGPQGYDTGLIEKSFDFWYAGDGHLGFYPKKVHNIFKYAKADTQPEVLDEGAESFLDTEQGFIQGAEAFLTKRPTDKPFFLCVAFNVPHGAGTGSMKLLPSDPELYRTAYRDRIDEMQLAPNYLAKADITTPKLPADVLYAGFRQESYNYVDTPATMKERLIRETQTITGIDRVVGALRATLAKQGLADNTVIIFASDHGIMSGEFGLGGKALNYEECLRIPLIVMDPAVPVAERGRRSLALAQSIDIAPTLLDYAHAPIPDVMQGQSLRPLVEGRTTTLRDFAFSENLWSTYFGNPRIESVRNTEWKYIRYFKNDRAQFASVTKKTLYNVTPSQISNYAQWLTASIKGEPPVYEELYHLASDPYETNNLAGRPAYADVLNQLRKECQRLVTAAKGDLNTPPATVVVPNIREGKNKEQKPE